MKSASMAVTKLAAVGRIPGFGLSDARTRPQNLRLPLGKRTSDWDQALILPVRMDISISPSMKMS